MSDATDARWLVAVDERSYGPYRRDQLASFLKPNHWVYHPSTDDWRPARDVAALAEVLAGGLVPAAEWYYRNPGKKEQGPVTREAIINMTKSGTITSDSLIRNAGWKEGMQILETPFAEELEIRELWLLNRLQKRGRLLMRPVDSAGPLPRLDARVGLLVVALVAAIGGFWELAGHFRKPELIRECGYPDGNCQVSRSSRCVCERSPMACGCLGSTRGQCEMKSCVDAARAAGIRIRK